MPSSECLSCTRLGACTEVTRERLLNHYVCDRYREEKPALVLARQATIQQFGDAAVHVLLEPPKEE